jgi:hypothetical protein
MKLINFAANILFKKFILRNSTLSMINCNKHSKKVAIHGRQELKLLQFVSRSLKSRIFLFACLHLRTSILENYERMEAEKTKLLVATQNQKVKQKGKSFMFLHFQRPRQKRFAQRLKHKKTPRFPKSKFNKRLPKRKENDKFENWKTKHYFSTRRQKPKQNSLKHKKSQNQIDYSLLLNTYITKLC